MAGDYKNRENKDLFGLMGDERDNSLSEKRKKAGKKGGNAPHRCRGRGCSNKNNFSEITNQNQDNNQNDKSSF